MTVELSPRDRPPAEPLRRAGAIPARTISFLPVLYGLLLSAAGFGLFYHLGDRLLWVDEAETGVLAQRVLRFGLPLARDGRNDIAFLHRATWVDERGIWIWSPWLDEYVAAASMLIWGESTVAARIVFVTAAWVMLAWLAWLAYRLTGDHRVALVVLALAVTSPALYWHARQCRYYALVMLAQVALIDGYRRALVHPRSGGWQMLAALVAQFYCNYILVVGNLAALVGAALLGLRRHPARIQLITTVISGFFLACIPWLWYARPWRQTSTMRLDQFGFKLGYYTTNLHFHVLPWVVLALPLGALAWRLARRRAGDAAFAAAAPQPDDEVRRSVELLLWLMIPAHLVNLCVTHGWFFRYLVVLQPVLFLLGGMLLVRYLPGRLPRYAAVAALCLTNAVPLATGFSASRGRRLESPYFNYLREITSDYRDRFEVVLEFLRRHVPRDGSVLVGNEEMPLIFYTDLRVIDLRMHPEVSTADLPDAVLTESASGLVEMRPVWLPPPVARYYDRVEIEVPDTPRLGVQPDPDLHNAFTPAQTRRLAIYLLRQEGPRDESEVEAEPPPPPPVDPAAPSGPRPFDDPLTDRRGAGR